MRPFLRSVVCVTAWLGLNPAVVTHAQTEGQPATSGAKPAARHVVLVVWDGLRPDSITDETTPTLAKLARDGVFFARHHSVYPTSTEVNGTALATGCYPGHNGLIGNREYRPAIDPFRSVATEELLTIRVGDAVSGGKYLQVPTLAELLHAAGQRTAVAGTKAVVTLQDRALRPDAKTLGDGSVTLYSGHTVPEDAVKLIERRLQGAAFPPLDELPNVGEDAWTTRALTEGLWQDGLPPFSVLWLSDPDFTQHKFGPESPQARKALASDDANLALVLKALDDHGWRDSTDVFVVSDHGFSTIAHQIDVARSLVEAGFDAHRSLPTAPKDGQVLVVGLGGAVFVYVVGHDPALVGRLAEHFQRTDFAGVILTRDGVPGTFPLRTLHLDSTDAPDLVMALRWEDHPNAHGFPGLMFSDGERKPGQGSHASLSRYELHNTLVGNGPDLRRGFRDELPSGNTDLAPTIAHLLALPNAPRMDGRILVEALTGEAAVNAAAPSDSPQTERLEASRALADGVAWKQYLQVTRYAGVEYFDEGNALPTATPQTLERLPPSPSPAP